MVRALSKQLCRFVCLCQLFIMSPTTARSLICYVRAYMNFFFQFVFDLRQLKNTTTCLQYFSLVHTTGITIFCCVLRLFLSTFYCIILCFCLLLLLLSSFFSFLYFLLLSPLGLFSFILHLSLFFVRLLVCGISPPKNSTASQGITTNSLLCSKLHKY